MPGDFRAKIGSGATQCLNTTILFKYYMKDTAMNEMAPWGKTYGRTSKTEFKNVVMNLSKDIMNYRSILYMRDMLYNPCHELDKAVELSKGLNNYEV